MKADSATNTKLDTQAESSSSGKLNKKKAALEAVPACRHSIFRYTPKRARQICAFCGAVRRIHLKKDNTATVGPWRKVGG